jgi:hypothetical protein
VWADFEWEFRLAKDVRRINSLSFVEGLLQFRQASNPPNLREPWEANPKWLKWAALKLFCPMRNLNLAKRHRLSPYCGSSGLNKRNLIERKLFAFRDGAALDLSGCPERCRKSRQRSPGGRSRIQCCLRDCVRRHVSV